MIRTEAFCIHLGYFERFSLLGCDIVKRSGSVHLFTCSPVAEIYYTFELRIVIVYFAWPTIFVRFGVSCTINQRMLYAFIGINTVC